MIVSCCSVIDKLEKGLKKKTLLEFLFSNTFAYYYKYKTATLSEITQENETFIIYILYVQRIYICIKSVQA